MVRRTVRYEVKIPYALHHLPQLRAWLKLQAAHWRVAYPPRQVNNIYFDTEAGDALRDNLRGVGVRRKLRLRWYGPDLFRVTAPRLELKAREGDVGWKAVHPLRRVTLDLRRLAWAEIVRTIREADPGADLWLSYAPRPTLINSYRRAYYVTVSGTVRLTVDEALRAYDQRWTSRPNLRHPAPLAPIGVVEFKAAPRDYPHLLLVVTAFPLRPARHSKYVRGLLALADLGGWP